LEYASNLWKRRGTKNVGVETKQELKQKVTKETKKKQKRRRAHLPRETSSKKEPPLPGPLLHQCVEEREMEWRHTFMGSIRERL
jgi:hypothetical protein